MEFVVKIKMSYEDAEKISKQFQALVTKAYPNLKEMSEEERSNVLKQYDKFQEFFDWINDHME